MVDPAQKMAHSYRMLSTKESRAKVPTEQVVSLDADLRFISENQRLEGFPGEISESVRQHQPDPKEIEAVARRFDAQSPKSVAPAKG